MNIIANRIKMLNRKKLRIIQKGRKREKQFLKTAQKMEK